MQIADESDVRELHQCYNYGTWILKVSSSRLSSRSLKTKFNVGGALARLLDEVEQLQERGAEPTEKWFGEFDIN